MVKFKIGEEVEVLEPVQEDTYEFENVFAGARGKIVAVYPRATFEYNVDIGHRRGPISFRESELKLTVE